MLLQDLSLSVVVILLGSARIGTSGEVETQLPEITEKVTLLSKVSPLM